MGVMPEAVPERVGASGAVRCALAAGGLPRVGVQVEVGLSSRNRGDLPNPARISHFAVQTDTA